MRMLTAICAAAVACLCLACCCPGGSGPVGTGPPRVLAPGEHLEVPDNPWPESQQIRDDLAARYPRDKVLILMWDSRRDVEAGHSAMSVVFGFSNRRGHHMASYHTKGRQLFLSQQPIDVDLDTIKAQRESDRKR